MHLREARTLSSSGEDKDYELQRCCTQSISTDSTPKIPRCTTRKSSQQIYDSYVEDIYCHDERRTVMRLLC